MSYWGWTPYVSVAERRKKAEKHIAKARKAGQELSPVAASRGAIAKTFWGKAWCDSLEGYGDYENRLPRGRTYVRNGSVLDLKIAKGRIAALVMGSQIYTVEIKIAELAAPRWRTIAADCAGSIDSLVELLQGRLSKAVMEHICAPRTGLFPAPGEIDFSCSCPDWADMCKHVAAVLYGVGARLDKQPELLFTLRGVDAKELIAHAGAAAPKTKTAPSAGKMLAETDLADVFGIELANAPPEKPVKAAKATRPPRQIKADAAAKAKTPKKTTAKRAVAKTAIAAKTPVAGQKAAAKSTTKAAAKAKARPAASPAKAQAKTPARKTPKSASGASPARASTRKPAAKTQKG